VRHTLLSEWDLVEVRALCEVDAMSGERVDRLRGYASHLVLDVLALRRELRSQLERARFEQERLLDMLDRARPHLPGTQLHEELRSLLAEIDDLLSASARRRLGPS
jgi:hypothetical protein